MVAMLQPCFQYLLFLKRVVKVILLKQWQIMPRIILVRVKPMVIIMANRVLIIWSQSPIVFIPILIPTPFAHNPPATSPPCCTHLEHTPRHALISGLLPPFIFTIHSLTTFRSLFECHLLIKLFLTTQNKVPPPFTQISIYLIMPFLSFPDYYV